MRLKGKVALITGGCSGIGLASARLFAREGAKIVIACRQPKKGKQAVETIDGEGSEATFVPTDVRIASDVNRMIQTAVGCYGKIDVLFNNAGTNMINSIMKTQLEDWNQIIATNLTGVFLCCKYGVPQMIRQRSGVIINNASTYSLVGRQGMTPYCASKGGVVAFTKALALEVAEFGIRVNCVCASTTVTPTVEDGWVKSGNAKGAREARLIVHPLGRLGEPEDIAHAVLYLASEESSWVTGSALVIDGGYTAQ